MKVIVIFLLLSFCIPRAHSQILGLELLPENEEIEIYFDYTYGFILVKVYLNNFLPLNFILDTGAEHVILFKKEIADILGFEYDKRINLLGSDLDREVFALISRGVPLRLEGTLPVSRDLIILEDDFLNLESMVGEPIDGILGSRFFRGLVLDIDYERQKLKLINRESFQPPGKNHQILPVQVENHKPYLHTSVITNTGEYVQVKLLLDTGSALPFLLFLDTHPSLNLPETVIRGNLGRGLGGDLQGYLGKVKTLNINEDIHFNNLITSFQNIEKGLDPEVIRNRNGLIGNPILARFHVIFDMIGERVFLKPLKNYNKDFDYDKSGLVLYAFGPSLDRYFVKDVIENSPAAEAGIRKGDVIKRVGILPAHFYSLSTISKKLQKKEGKKVRLTFLRNGKKIRKTIVLRDLIED